MRSFEYLLTLADWQFFGTLTWRDSNLGSIRSRETDVEEFLRQEAARKHVSLTDMPLVIRWERGEQNERPHCHFLVSGFPDSIVHRTTGHRLSHHWYSLHGLARIRPYCAALRAEVARYMDYENIRESNIEQANRYERSKFDRADCIVANDAAWAQWQRITGTSFSVARCT